jgi:hypothetical protein
MTSKLKAVDFTGQHGSWHARVDYNDGTSENLPCVHDYFWKNGGGGAYYMDPDQTPTCNGKESLKHWDNLRKMRRVILTKDKVNPGHAPGAGRFERLPKPEGYIGVYDIADAECTEESSLFFRFIDRVC